MNSTNAQRVSQGATVLYCVVLGAVLMTAVFGNCLVLLAVKRTRSLRNTAAILVVNLACVDLAVTVCSLPFVIVTASAQQWVLSREVCTATAFMNAFFGAAQIMALLHISLNRFLAVTYPHSYHTKLSIRITLAMVVTGWVYSFLWTHLPFYGWGSLGFIKGTLFCNILWSQQLSFAVTAQVLCYFIPCIIAGILYLVTYINVRKHWKRAKERTQSMMSLGETNIAAAVTQSMEIVTASVTQSAVEVTVNQKDLESGKSNREAARSAKSSRKRRRAMENRVTKTLLGVAFGFAVCWFPRGVANLWALFMGREMVPIGLEYASTAFVFMNSSVNPAIYGALNQDFYKAFISILSCQKIKRSRSDSEIPSGSMSQASSLRLGSCNLHVTANRPLGENGNHSSMGTK
ncbi:alpha-1A adrenergic receptor-like [Exaiptasia diaphana]|uniref:G-protein coupled receptors family 1 profile domain-containing protein n=1 Tax=Exaiptasia diaphana TaxID=2652724 RepID=A0A913X0H8_EXADI|nr:alpha-1A adrenergic receptor-like [Exaiptasia diaphana]